MIPWVDSGSFHQPASPTSAQPGPYGRHSRAGIPRKTRTGPTGGAATRSASPRSSRASSARCASAGRRCRSAAASTAGGPPAKTHPEAVVRRDGAGGQPVAVVPVVAVQVRGRPVPVDVRRAVGARHDGRCRHAGGYQGVASVGTDHERSVLGPGGPTLVAQDHTDHAAGAVAGQVGHGEAEAESRAGVLGGVDEQGIEDGATRRVQGITPAYGFSETGMGSAP